MIRRATLADLAAIVDIYNQAVADRFATADTSPVTVEQRRPWFEEHDEEYPICVLESEGSSEAGIRSAPIDRAVPPYATRLNSPTTSMPIHAGVAMGPTLITHALAEAPRLGKRVLFCIILERNEASIRLMKRCGFELWGRLPGVASSRANW